jgi:hypothetical protein
MYVFKVCQPLLLFIMIFVFEMLTCNLLCSIQTLGCVLVHQLVSNMLSSMGLAQGAGADVQVNIMGPDGVCTTGS